MNTRSRFLSLSLVAAVLSSSFAYAQRGDGSPPVEGDKGFLIAGTTGVLSTTVGTPGTGYTSLPTVAFSGGSGSVQATGTSTLKAVGTTTVAAGGTGYTVGDVLTLVGGTKSVTATFTVSTVSSGVITAVSITNAGVYTVIPSAGAAVTGGTGTGATLTPGYGVGTIVLTSAGTGYATAPTIGFSGGGGSSAAATATLDTFTITADFKQIIPIADCVIASITFPAKTRLDRPAYAASTALIGKTLTKGVTYNIWGSSILLTSGQAILIRQ